LKAKFEADTLSIKFYHSSRYAKITNETTCT